ncbi:MAG: ATP-binding protein [Kofleriaceae bacterium]
MSEPRGPSSAAVLAAVTELSRHLHLELSESELVEHTLSALAPLFPDRMLALRVLDLRSGDPMRIYSRGGVLRPGLEGESLTIKDTAAGKTGLKSAVLASARLRTSGRWDSPFVGAMVGFAVPLVAAGELYGVLDVGYAGVPSGDAPLADDEQAALPLANALALAVRNQHLYRDTALLRDYQARLIESAGALIIGIDRTWRIAVYNRAMAELTGYAPEEVVGRDLRDLLLRWPDRARLLSVFRAALRGAYQSAVTAEVPRRAGGVVRTVWTIAPVGRAVRLVAEPDANAGVVGAESIVLIGQDQSRVHDLQQQVIRAERLATLGELAAGVVHELNNPLTSITVYAEYLQRKLESAACDANDLEKLRRIGASAQRILRFSRELVQYARPSTSESEPVDLCAVVERSISFCEHLFEPEQVELRRDLQPVPLVAAVKAQLEQVIINLLTNAVHATGGHGAIELRVSRTSQNELALEVCDSGPGVPEQDRERIFEPFFTTKPDGKGTGLGLSIVRNIIEQHRGHIEVTDGPLGGARFVITLPLESH